jgi:RNA polymerase sigma-70 factor (ECF subfamily)
MQITQQKFDEVYLEYRDKLSKFVFGLLKDYSEVQTIVQITFMKLWKQHFPDIEDKLAPWLFTVARNTTFKHINKTKKFDVWSAEEFDEKPADVVDPRETLISKEQKDIDLDKLHVALASLPERHRRILELRYFSNLSYAQIADEMSLTQGNVGFIINRAKDALKIKFNLKKKNDRTRKDDSGKSKDRDSSKRRVLAGVNDSIQSSK